MTMSGIPAVLLTRSRERMSDTVQALEEEGIAIRCAAVVRTAHPDSWEALDRAIDNAAGYRGLVCTSENGLVALADRAATRSARVQATIRSLPVFVVGEASARLGAALGFPTKLLPGVVDAASLAIALPKALPANTRLLHIRGDLADSTLQTGLRERGFVLDDAIAYRTVPASDAEQEAIREMCHSTPINAVVFFSPSSVDGLVACVGEDWIRERSVVALGKRTSARLAKLGIVPDFVPDVPSVGEVVRYLRNRVSSTPEQDIAS